MGTDIPVETDGDKISVGGKIILKTKNIQKLLGQTPKEYVSPVDENESIPRRHPVSGRNAYEIRADVLQMAVEWAEGKCNKTEEVLDITNKFYAFVEDKRRR